MREGKREKEEDARDDGWRIVGVVVVNRWRVAGKQRCASFGRKGSPRVSLWSRICKVIFFFFFLPYSLFVFSFFFILIFFFLLLVFFTMTRLKRSWIPRQGSNRKRSAGENKMTVNGEGENGENSFPTMKKEKIK